MTKIKTERKMSLYYDNVDYRCVSNCEFEKMSYTHLD